MPCSHQDVMEQKIFNWMVQILVGGQFVLCMSVNVIGSDNRMVPKLKEIHVLRDSWTKLNVTPARLCRFVGIHTCYNLVNIIARKCSVRAALIC